MQTYLLQVLAQSRINLEKNIANCKRKFWLYMYKFIYTFRRIYVYVFVRFTSWMYHKSISAELLPNL